MNFEKNILTVFITRRSKEHIMSGTLYVTTKNPCYDLQKIVRTWQPYE